MFFRTVEEFFAGRPELIGGFEIVVVKDLFLEEFPQSLDQVQVRSIGRQEYELDSRGLQILLNSFGTVIARVVANDVDPSGEEVQLLKLLEQVDNSVSN